MNPKEIVIKFNECIDNQDIDSLSQFLHEDYTFIDSANNIQKGKQNGINSWTGFFNQFPDYKNIFERFIEKDSLVIVTGHSVCSNKMLDGPAIWTAKIKDDKIYEWRVYDDTLENRISLGID